MSTTTKERPILFSAPMVNAILADKKTQTRRVVKPQPYEVVPPDGGCGRRWEFSKRGLAYAWNTDAEPLATGMVAHCPYGMPGERLWVREAWARGDTLEPDVLYRADDERRGRTTWRPSIHMPRWASRITLEITETDAKAEGVDDFFSGVYFPGYIEWSAASANFRRLWDALNAARGFAWEANPWVWVVSFRRIDAEGSNA